ncbi:MAG: EF-hand domain-containing protein [Armatimonadota bacterium]
MRTKKTLIVVAVSALLVGALAVGFTAPAAQQGRGGPADMDPAAHWARLLDHCDANEDGVISRDEFEGPEHAFTRLDTNEDGQITKDEGLAPRQRAMGQGGPRGDVDPADRWARLLDHCDANGDGVISKDEFQGPEHAFTRLDANADGQITQDEGLAPRQRMGEGGPQRGNIDPAARWQRMLEHLDADASGTISQEEFPGHEQAFARIDANGDGQITQDEAAQVGQGRRGGGGPGMGQGQGPRGAEQ